MISFICALATCSRILCTSSSASISRPCTSICCKIVPGMCTARHRLVSPAVLRYSWRSSANVRVCLRKSHVAYRVISHISTTCIHITGSPSFKLAAVDLMSLLSSPDRSCAALPPCRMNSSFWRARSPPALCMGTSTMITTKVIGTKSWMPN